MRPLVPAGRIVGVDAARCVALVGMVATHVIVLRDADGVTLVHQVAGGRSSALFAVLAGVSLALMSGGRSPVRGVERRAVTAGFVGRAGVVVLIGLLLGELGANVAVILVNYGVLFCLALPFLGLRTRSLVPLAAAWIVVVPVLSQLVRPLLPVAGMDSPRLSGLAQPSHLLSELLLTGYYPALPWLGYLLVGLAVGRLDLSSRRTAGRLVVLGATLAGATAVLADVLLAQPVVVRALSGTSVVSPAALADRLDGGLYGTTPAGGSWWWLVVDAAHSGTPVDLAHTTGTALLVLGVALVVAERLPRTVAVLLGAGTMTLTLYSLHVVLRMPQLLGGESTSVFEWHVLILLGLGAGFRLLRLRGPLEVLAGEVHRQLARRALVMRGHAT